MRVLTGCGIAVLLAGLLSSAGAGAAQFGNDTAASGRPVMADGTTYTDQMTPTSTVAWFVFRVDPNQSYSIEVWSPFGRFGDLNNAVAFVNLYEADGATPIATTHRSYDLPSPQVDVTWAQGDRLGFVNAGPARRVALFVQKNGGAPATAVDFAVRVVTTTLAAPRWSVNGYNGYFAISNVSSTDAIAPVAGSIIYYGESGAQVGADSFSLGANASTQIVKPNGVPIGGAIRGGVRVVHDGAPGTILAHQTLFSPGTGQFIQYPFAPLVHSYGRGGL